MLMAIMDFEVLTAAVTSSDICRGVVSFADVEESPGCALVQRKATQLLQQEYRV